MGGERHAGPPTTNIGATAIGAAAAPRRAAAPDPAVAAGAAGGGRPGQAGRRLPVERTTIERQHSDRHRSAGADRPGLGRAARAGAGWLCPDALAGHAAFAGRRAGAAAGRDELAGPAGADQSPAAVERGGARAAPGRWRGRAGRSRRSAPRAADRCRSGRSGQCGPGAGAGRRQRGAGAPPRRSRFSRQRHQIGLRARYRRRPPL